MASGTEVTLTCATADAQIYYTLDGSDPTTESMQYSDSNKPKIEGTAGAEITLKAIAVLGENQSAVQTLTYTIKEVEYVYQQITELDELLAGGNFVFAVEIAEGKYRAIGSEFNYQDYLEDVEATVEDGVLTFGEDMQIFTVSAINGQDNKVSLSSEGKYLYSGQYQPTLSWSTTQYGWLASASESENGTFRLSSPSNANRYLSWRGDPYEEFGANVLSSSNVDTYIGDLLVFRQEEKTETNAPIAAGDQVVIYAPAYNKALSSEKTGFYNVGTDITVSEGTVSGYGENDVWTVVDNGDNTYSFQQNGRNIGLGESYASMDLGAVNDDWELIDLGNGRYNIRNTVRGNYMEWYAQYSNWSTYNSNSVATDDQFQLSFYKVTGETPDPEPSEAPFKANDTIVIYAPSNNMALSATVKNDYYPIGVKVAVKGDTLTGYGATEVWTVGGEDGAWTFTSNSGKTLSMAGSYSSVYPGAGDNDYNEATATATITIKKAVPAMTLSASPSSLTGGGTVTLTLTGAPGSVTVTCTSDSGITVTEVDGQQYTWTVTLPSGAKSYTFSAAYAGDDNHESAAATCTVTVRSSGGGSTGGGSGGTSGVNGSGDNVSISPSGGSVTSSQMGSAVKKADEGSTITIKATSSTTVTLPVGGMAEAADNHNDIVVDLRSGEVVLSARAVASMTDGASASGRVEVVITSQTNSKDETISDLMDKGAAVFDVSVEVDGKSIHSFDGDLTISFTVSNLSKISDPHILHILTDGSKEYYAPDSISGNTITVKGIRNLSTFAVIPGSEMPKEPANPFTDVYESDYYYDAVLWAVENGVTNGTSAATFGPDMAVSRAQMVTFLWRTHGSPKATGTNPFTDVSTSDYYYDAVLWAVANGVTNGTSATTFSPDMDVTRAQAVTFQWRAAGSTVMSGTSFDDVAADAYYANAVTWAVANGITNGTGGNNFSPDQIVSRAQAVTFLHRHNGRSYYPILFRTASLPRGCAPTLPSTIRIRPVIIPTLTLC